TIGQLDLDGDVLPRLGLRQRTAVRTGEDEADGVRRLLAAAGDDEIAPDVTRGDVVAGVEFPLGLDQRVCHVPVDLGPGVDDLWGGRIAQNLADGGEEMLV